jgi:hypothetical protein
MSQQPLKMVRLECWCNLLRSFDEEQGARGFGKGLKVALQAGHGEIQE